jgi:hypothetical protein
MKNQNSKNLDISREDNSYETKHKLMIPTSLPNNSNGETPRAWKWRKAETSIFDWDKSLLGA